MQSNKYIALLETLLNDPSMLEFLRYNKVITTIGFLALHSDQAIQGIFKFKLQRYNIYLEETKRLAEKLEYNGIEYTIMKTFSAIPKDISDIDLLVSPEHAMDTRRILLKLGFYPRKTGLEQDLYSKLVDNVTVDVELHTSIAAAGYEYYDSRRVLRRSIVFNGIRVSEPIDSVLILVAHDVMKDLYIPLAHILEFYSLLNNAECDELIKQASLYGLSLPLSFFTILTESIIGEKLRCKMTSHILKLLLPDLAKALKMDPVIKVPLLLTLTSYMENLQSKVRLEGFSTTLKQLISLPSGKGINALIHNVLPAKPEVKEIWE